MMKKYPTCFPENFETKILPKGAKKEKKVVYRIIKKGKITRDSFISTYEEIKKGLIPSKKNINLNDPELYSTSCNEKYEDAQYALDVFMRHYPTPFIAKGYTHPSCGPCQLTSERKKSNGSHVDWWIYEESSPHEYFEEVKENEK